MGWEEDNRDYAQERRLNISPFRTEYSLIKFVSSTAGLIAVIPLAIAIRSVWIGAVTGVLLLFTVNSQSFKFMWGSAPWFQTLVGVMVMALSPIALVVVIWPLPWLGGIGTLAASLFAFGYFKNCKAFCREFNIPDREP